MSHLRLLGLAVSALLVLPRPIEAADCAFLDQNPARHAVADGVGNAVVADDFQLAAPAQLSRVRWYGLYGWLAVPDDFTIRLFDDAGGSPGSVLIAIHAGA